MTQREKTVEVAATFVMLFIGVSLLVFSVYQFDINIKQFLTAFGAGHFIKSAFIKGKKGS